LELGRAALWRVPATAPPNLLRNLVLRVRLQRGPVAVQVTVVARTVDHRSDQEEGKGGGAPGGEGSTEGEQEESGQEDGGGRGSSRSRDRTTFCQDPECPGRRRNVFHKARVVRLSKHFAFAVGTDVVKITYLRKEPRPHREAVRSPEPPTWTKACGEEVKSQRGSCSWELVPLTGDTSVVECTWVLQRKRSEVGAPAARWKARLVTRGFRQGYGLDYSETFAPVARASSVRAVLAAAAALDLELVNWGVDAAFLSAGVKEVVCVKLPEGYEKKGKSGEVLVCRLLKPLCGLKQAPGSWSQHVGKCLTGLGFVASRADPCVHTKTFPAGGVIILVLCVDGLTVAVSSVKTVSELKAPLGKECKVRTLGMHV